MVMRYMILTKKIVIEPHQLNDIKKGILNKSKSLFEKTLVYEVSSRARME